MMRHETVSVSTQHETGPVSGETDAVSAKDETIASLTSEVERLSKLLALKVVRQGDLGMKPWQAAGMSKASWYRKQAKAKL